MWILQGNHFSSHILYFQGMVYFEDKALFILRNFIWVRNHCDHFADKATETEDQQTNMAQISLVVSQADAKLNKLQVLSPWLRLVTHHLWASASSSTA